MITYDRYAFVLACIGTGFLVYQACFAIDRLAAWFSRRSFERRRSAEPVRYLSLTELRKPACLRRSK